MRTEFCYRCAILLHAQEPLVECVDHRVVVGMQRRRGNVDSRLINAAVVTFLCLRRGRLGERALRIPVPRGGMRPFPEAGPAHGRQQPETATGEGA